MFSPLVINFLTTHSDHKNTKDTSCNIYTQNSTTIYIFIKLKINYACLKRSLKALKDKATKVYFLKNFSKLDQKSIGSLAKRRHIKCLIRNKSRIYRWWWAKRSIVETLVFETRQSINIYKINIHQNNILNKLFPPNQYCKE